MEFAKANLTPKAGGLRYFNKEREDHWKCKCGKVIQQKTNKGYSNLSQNFAHFKEMRQDGPVRSRWSADFLKFTAWCLPRTSTMTLLCRILYRRTARNMK